jgi:molecular chaperone DnaK (HSP70)
LAANAEWSIGVDFGTAFSKAACTRIMSAEGATLREVRPLAIGQAGGASRPFLAPSSLFLDRERVHFGAWAVKRLIAANLEERELVRSFKTILGANDFEGALNFYPRPTVDPDRMFRLRDLIILYLAYLLALVDITAARSLGVARFTERSRLRFTRPGWLPDRIAAAHEAMSALFSQAHLVHLQLGDALARPEGVPYAAARMALDKAQAQPAAFSRLDGGVYEASAVGLCYYSDPAAPSLLLIVDVGGGTTDVAALVRAPFESEVRVIRAGRRTINTAGDYFDNALVELLLAKSRLKTEAERTALWHRIVPVIRDLKEELFAKGSLQLTFRAAKIACTARELERQPTFRAGVAQIRRLYESCLSELIAHGHGEGIRQIGVVLAGGGSRIPAINRVVLRRTWRGLARVKLLPSTPQWVQELGNAQEFAPHFSQLSAAFGAAISAREGLTTPPPETQVTTRPAPSRVGP